MFLCERGELKLSQFMAERLHSGFVSKTEEPEDFRIKEGWLPLRRTVVLSRMRSLDERRNAGTGEVSRVRSGTSGKYLHQHSGATSPRRSMR